MNKRNWTQEIKDWWNENKAAIKAGITFGAIGMFYGLATGMSATNKLWMDHGFTPATDDFEEPCDEFELTDENCDDPELAEIVKFEIENS